MKTKNDLDYANSQPNENELQNYDVGGMHLDTIDDILELLDVCQDNVDEKVVPTEKFDEIRHYTWKLKRDLEYKILNKSF